MKMYVLKGVGSQAETYEHACTLLYVHSTLYRLKISSLKTGVQRKMSLELIYKCNSSIDKHKHKQS